MPLTNVLLVWTKRLTSSQPSSAPERPLSENPSPVSAQSESAACLLFEVLQRSPPVVWCDRDRRRIWCSYLATQIVDQLALIWLGSSRLRTEAEETIAGQLFLGPAPQADAFARRDWAHAVAQDVLACLHPFLERTDEHAS